MRLLRQHHTGCLYSDRVATVTMLTAGTCNLTANQPVRGLFAAALQSARKRVSLPAQRRNANARLLPNHRASDVPPRFLIATNALVGHWV
jgi:hypothetical protein